MQTKVYGHLEVLHAHDSGVGSVSIPVSDNPIINNDNLYQCMVQFGIIFYGSWR
jgi:hypothetical protein